MAKQTELVISPREIMGKATKRLRKQGIIPANIFGHNEASQAVQVDAILFDRLVREHKASSVLALRLPDENVQTALIRHVQHEPRSGKIVHIDFFRVSLRERISVKIPLHFVGEAPAVKIEGGVLLHLLDTIEVECAAGDIPEYFEVDITSMAEFDSMIHVGDVKLPSNVTLHTSADEPVAKVAAPRVEAEETEEAAEGEASTAATETAEASTSEE